MQMPHDTNKVSATGGCNAPLNGFVCNWSENIMHRILFASNNWFYYAISRKWPYKNSTEALIRFGKQKNHEFHQMLFASKLAKKYRNFNLQRWIFLKNKFESFINNVSKVMMYKMLIWTVLWKNGAHIQIVQQLKMSKFLIKVSLFI